MFTSCLEIKILVLLVEHLVPQPQWLQKSIVNEVLKETYISYGGAKWY